MPKVHRRIQCPSSNAKPRLIGPYQFGRYSASSSSTPVEQQVSSRSSLERRLKQKKLLPLANNPSSSPIRQMKMTAASGFERLPTEILELIFFQCLNLNLPLASSNLGSALSSFSVKSRLFFMAFSADDFSYYDFKLKHSDQLLSILWSEREIAILQTSILKRRWMTMDFLHQCMPLYLEKVWQSLGQISGLEAVHDIVPRSLTATTATSYIKKTGQVGVRWLMRYNETRSAQWWFGTERLFIGTGLPDGFVSLHEANSGPKWLRKRFMCCKPTCQIPEKLLAGPWRRSDGHLLETMLRNGATSGLTWASSNAEDLGLKNALRDSNKLVLELFTNRTWREINSHVTSPQRFHGPLSPETFKKIGLGFTFSSAHLTDAAIKYDYSFDNLKVILNRHEFEDDYDPAVEPLRSWAQQKKAEDDRRGNLILRRFKSCPLKKSSL